MTTEHEALQQAWMLVTDAFHLRDETSWVRFREGRRAVERAIRAQVDEDVRRLVEAVVRPHVLFWCGADLDGSGNNFCRRWATWSFHDWEWSAWRCYEHAHQKPDWWDDEEQGEWVTQYEEDAKAVALVAALEPFKAVAPPADAEEADRG